MPLHDFQGRIIKLLCRSLATSIPAFVALWNRRGRTPNQLGACLLQDRDLLLKVLFVGLQCHRIITKGISRLVVALFQIMQAVVKLDHVPAQSLFMVVPQPKIHISDSLYR